MIFFGILATIYTSYGTIQVRFVIQRAFLLWLRLTLNVHCSSCLNLPLAMRHSSGNASLGTCQGSRMPARFSNVFIEHSHSVDLRQQSFGILFFGLSGYNALYGLLLWLFVHIALLYLTPDYVFALVIYAISFFIVFHIRPDSTKVGAEAYKVRTDRPTSSSTPSSWVAAVLVTAKRHSPVIRFTSCSEYSQASAHPWMVSDDGGSLSSGALGGGGFWCEISCLSSERLKVGTRYVLAAAMWRRGMRREMAWSILTVSSGGS